MKGESNHEVWMKKYSDAKYINIENCLHFSKKGVYFHKNIKQHPETFQNVVK